MSNVQHTESSVRRLPIKGLRLSQTSAQAERRAHFDKGKLKELAASITSTGGLIQPIGVRPAKIIRTQGLNGIIVAGKTYFSPDEAEAAARNTFEIIFGERRYLAAQIAGLEEIDCSVRDLTDEQVEEVQLVENLQREDLHELAEAEGYEALQKRGMSIDDIAAKVGGKSKATIYARMKLLALCKDARKAFYEGKLTASTALLLARLTGDDVQKKALHEITHDRHGNDPIMSYRDAAEHVHENYMLRLDQAEFKTGDADLVPKAGPCGTCPKNSARQPELFADVSKRALCTDPTCFAAKVAASRARKLAEAKASGQRIITGAEAKKVAPYGLQSSLHEGFVSLDARCYEDPKNRTYRQLLGKSGETPAVLVNPEDGRIVEVVQKTAVDKSLRDRGARVVTKEPQSGTQRAAEKKARAEKAFRRALFEKVREKYPKELNRADWNALGVAMVHEMQQETVKQLFALRKWEPKKERYGYGDYRKAAADYIGALPGTEIARFFLDCIFVSDLQVSTWSDAKPEVLFAGAKRFGVNVDQVRRTLNAAQIPKGKRKKKG